MSNNWGFLFEEGADFSAIRKRHRMEKTAGVFMRPSDIAGHTELAAKLEGMMNGQPGGSTFKDQPGEQKTAGAAGAALGAIIGGTCGYFASRSVNPVPPPQDTKGFSNKVKHVRHQTYKFKEEHPRGAAIAATAVGALVGGYTFKDADILRRLKDFKRGT